MTNERQNPGSDGETDDLVSRTYRELADEITPDDLNETILRRAARAVRSNNSGPTLWARPLAWAAAIAIGLAITLQLVRAPTPNSAIVNTVPAAATQETLDANGSIDIYGAEPPSAEFLAGGLSAAKPTDETERSCDREAKAGPATWLDCISDLEQAGFRDEAKRQREQLSGAFPEFEVRRD